MPRAATADVSNFSLYLSILHSNFSAKKGKAGHIDDFCLDLSALGGRSETSLVWL